jgi:chaperonin GroES
MRPLGERIVVRRVNPEGISKGGIIIPNNAQEKPQKAIVLEVGPGRTENGDRIKPDVKKGDMVLFAKHAGVELSINEETFLIIKESDLLAVL